jgi:hypothetical protein
MRLSRLQNEHCSHRCNHCLCPIEYFSCCAHRWRVTKLSWVSPRKGNPMPTRRCTLDKDFKFPTVRSIQLNRFARQPSLRKPKIE